MRQNMLKDRSLAANNTKLKSANGIGSRNIKNAHGITLIALVITIIVLLILAGVSISAITGNDSAMEKAKQAKTASEKGDELDTIKLAVVDAVAHSNDGFVTLANLQNAVKDLDGVSADNGDEAGTFEVTGKKESYIVYANGQIEKVRGLRIRPGNLQIFEGETGTLTATVSEDMENQTVTWKAKNGAAFLVNNAETTETTTEGTSSVTVKALAGTITAEVEGEETKTCTVTVKSMPRIGTAEDAGQYGNKVVLKSDNTTAYTAGGIDTWRLFYKDGNYAYLISETKVGPYNPKTEITDSTTNQVKHQYANGSKVSAVGKGLNYNLISNHLFESSNTNLNIQVTAWMTDISANGPWTSYKGEDTEYVIGGPTVELFVASVNAAGGSASCSPMQAGYNYYGFFNDSRHKIWGGNGNWHFASPAEYENGPYNVGATNTYIAAMGNEVNRYFRPIIMIPTTTFDAKYTTVDD